MHTYNVQLMQKWVWGWWCLDSGLFGFLFFCSVSCDHPGDYRTRFARFGCEPCNKVFSRTDPARGTEPNGPVWQFRRASYGHGPVQTRRAPRSHSRVPVRPLAGLLSSFLSCSTASSSTSLCSSRSWSRRRRASASIPSIELW